MGKRSAVLKTCAVIGGGYRINCRCPYCDSLDRERLLFEFLKKETTVFQQKNLLLHIAPEPNIRKVFEEADHVIYVRADISRKRVDVQMDITRLSFANNTFDALLCSHVLEHIPNDKVAISELFRVLKPGGWAVLQVPISWELEKTIEDPECAKKNKRKRYFGDPDHLRIYGPDYITRLQEAGFKVKKSNTTDLIPHEFIRQYALNPRESIFFVTK